MSRDSDFWDDSRTGFHSDLVEDLAAIGAAERVRLAADLWAAVLKLASHFDSDAADMDALREELRFQTVLSYLTQFVAEEACALTLNARECGLPLRTNGVEVSTIATIEHLVYSVEGGVAEGEAVAAFSFTAETTLTVLLPLDAIGEYLPDDVVSTSDAGVVVRLVKPLDFRGVLQLGRYDRPLGAEVTLVEATPDDPGRRYGESPSFKVVLELGSSTPPISLTCSSSRAQQLKPSDASPNSPTPSNRQAPQAKPSDASLNSPTPSNRQAPQAKPSGV